MKILTRKYCFSPSLFYACLLGLHTVAQAVPQVIWVDFDSKTGGSDHVYTAAECSSVLDGLGTIFAPFGHTFTTTDPSPVLTTKIEFNTGGVGTSSAIDFRNLITSGDLAAVDSGFALDLFSKPKTSANVVQSSINLAAHELLHVLGTRHHDAFGPIGTGAGGGETSSTFMSLTTLLGIDGDAVINEDLYMSPRSAMKLEFADAGTVVAETGAPNDSIISAQFLPLPDFPFPNTVPADNPLFGLEFGAMAVSVLGALDGTSDIIDYYAFDGLAGDIFTIELMSDAIDHRVDPFDAEIEILDLMGTPLSFSASSLDGEDPVVLDLMLPVSGPIIVEVKASPMPSGSLDGDGEYELFIYKAGAAAIPVPAAIWLFGGGLCLLVGLGRRP